MNRIFKIFLAVLFTFYLNESSAQKLNYKTDSGFDIGFGIGGSYQGSDIRNSQGFGADFTFGHSIYQRENAFFSLEGRFRFLAGKNKAFDDRINLDSTYSNVEYSHLNFDLELVLTLNRLRNRTGIIISGFAGAGAAHNKTKFDYFSDFDNGNKYDYSVIDPFGLNNRRQIYDDLKFLSDYNFETDGINNFCFTPTAGFYFGYQFTKHFSLGIEHKVNYFLNETNQTFGANIDGKIIPGSPIDRNYYTTLAFKWDIGRHHPRPDEIPCEVPLINFEINKINDSFATHRLEGTISFVNDRNNLSVRIDGKTDYNFNFYPNTNQITADYKFLPGTHTVVISAMNECGNNSETKRITVNQPCTEPSVKINVNNIKRNNASNELVGTVENINNKRDITLTIDGKITDKFNFFPVTGTISADLRLSTGNHTLTVSALNNCGRDSKTIHFYTNGTTPCNPPEINFNVKEINHPDFNRKIIGTAYNVKNRSELTIKINGRLFNAFQFYPNTGQISANLNLVVGSHKITVSANNRCGYDSKTQNVSVNPPCLAPEINMNITEINSTYASHEISGIIYNVKNKNDITVRVDGKIDYNFRFFSNTGRITSDYKFLKGSHIIKVSADNGCGYDTKTFRITVEAPCNPPEVNFNISNINYNNFTHKISGTILFARNKSDIQIKIDNRIFNAFQFIPNTKKISANLKLLPGTHTITISANNGCGYDSETKTVIENEPCYPPVVNFNINEVSGNNRTHQLSGTLSNVKNKSQITVKADGRIINNFQYNPNTKRITAYFNFYPGTHSVIVSANNDCGYDSQNITVTVNEPCNPPVVNVNISEVNNNNNVTHQLSGTVSNVRNKSNISLKLDGRPFNNFQFIPSTKRISANFKLSPGTHTIIVSAQNECGRDSETKTVVVNEPCYSPVVNFNISEVNNNNNVTHQLSGTVSNVRNKSNISLKLDGRPFNNFQFIPSTKRISANFKLSPGTHTIIVSAQNECGRDSETKTVVVNEPCYSPVVNFNISEVNNNNNVTHKLSGTVSNVRNKSNISLKLDGRIFNNFQFIPSTKRISANFKLSPGTHTIIVSAQNECGRDSETKTVIVNEPCYSPVVNFNISEVNNNNNVMHQLSGTVSNVRNKSNISLKLDGRVFNNFQFIPNTKRISANFKLSPGTHTIIVSAQNECGRDSETKTVVVNEPCYSPVVNFNISKVNNNNNVTHQLSGTVRNVRNKSNISLKLDGRVFNNFQFIPSTKRISANFKLSPGTHTIIVSAQNECGRDSETKTVVVNEPCYLPVVNFNISEVNNNNNVTHQLSGTVRNVRNKSNISLKLDGRVFNNFQFIPSTKRISANFKLSPGTHTIIVSAQNECGRDSETKTVMVEEEEETCGPRINPGNSDWQFCLVTPSGTYNRQNLTNSNFTYSGPASSLFFKAIAGGGDAIVNGNHYTILPGKYYLFTGNLTVSVSTKNPGSMGHWSVCINANKEPEYGTGNNRPHSPCEDSKNKGH